MAVADASNALIISAGPLTQFLLLQQGVTSAAEIDWHKVIYHTSPVLIEVKFEV